jgi:osmotically-inducible protein OsmY
MGDPLTAWKARAAIRLLRGAPGRSDEELYEDICEALLHRDDVDSSEVTVAVRAGEVALDGSVPERRMRYLIEDLAAGHPAVRDVENRITVRKA